MTNHDQAPSSLLVADSTTSAASLFGALVEDAVVLDYDAAEDARVLDSTGAAYLGPGAGFERLLAAACERVLIEPGYRVVVALGDQTEPGLRAALARDDALVVERTAVLPSGHGLAVTVAAPVDGPPAHDPVAVLDIVSAVELPPRARSSDGTEPGGNVEERSGTPAVDPVARGTWRRRASTASSLLGARSRRARLALLTAAAALALVLIALLAASLTTSAGIDAAEVALVIAALLVQAATVRLVLVLAPQEDPRVDRLLTASRRTRALLDRRTQRLTQDSRELERRTAEITTRVEPYLQELAAEQSRMRALLESALLLTDEGRGR